MQKKKKQRVSAYAEDVVKRGLEAVDEDLAETPAAASPRPTLTKLVPAEGEPSTWEDAVALVRQRDAAAGHPVSNKRAKRAAAMAWPELHKAAGSPLV